jgi:hypothetical protein
VIFSSFVLQTVISKVDKDVFRLHILELFYDEDRACCIARDMNIDDEYYELEMLDRY